METVRTGEHALTSLARPAEPLSLVPPSAAEHLNHTVQFYDDDAFLASVVGDFLAAGLDDAQPVIVIATRQHRNAFARRLKQSGLDLEELEKAGHYQAFDARETLRKFMVGDVPDATKFTTVIGGLIERTLRGRAKTSIRAYGEMVDLLWKDGNVEGAIQLERLWNALTKHHEFTLLCAYSMGNFCRSNDAQAFLRVCAEHGHVIPTEQYLRTDEAGKLREVSELQQRSRAYEAEVIQRELVEHQLRDTVAALHEREQDLRDVLENAPLGIHLVGPDGTILWANQSELDMLGYAQAEYVGRNIADFYVDPPVIESVLGRLSAGETLHDVGVRLRHKNGSIRDVLVNSNVRWRDGKFVHTRCFSRDVTELRAAFDEREELLASERHAREDAESARLEEAKARTAAEQANRAKSEFLAVMSHELRTPLNAIGGYVELLELGIHGTLTEAQRESLTRIQRSQRMLLGLINQVLNYARVETGSIRYELQDVGVDESLRTAAALIIPQLRGKGLRFTQGECDVAVAARADGDKFQQIVLNLLTNAVKFTDSGGSVQLEVAVEPSEVRITVSDTGIGIPADKLALIFDPFVQVDPNYTRTRDGVGLGLAISRDLARGMGGELSVRSVYGEGSSFTLTLPRVA